MQSFKLKFSGVTILQGVEFPIFLLIFEWALQQCSATALPVIGNCIRAFDWYLDDLEGRNILYFAFFSPNSTDFQADYITVVEDRPIMSVKYCLPVPVFYFWRKL